MKSRVLPYLFLTFLFVVSMVVFVDHARPILVSLERVVDPSHSVRVPFEHQNGLVESVLPEAAEAGMRPGDRLVAINGHRPNGAFALDREFASMQVGDKATYSVVRGAPGTETEQIDLVADTRPVTIAFRDAFTSFSITFLFLLCLPGISFLLGFYVAFMRPRDPLAWTLLLLLLGIGSIAVEGWPEGTLVRTFQEIALNCLGVWMVLFGFYFPERLEFDRKHPFVKWFILLPLILNGLLAFVEQIGRLLELEWLWRPVDSFTKSYDNVSALITMVAISIFFAAMGVKSATIENKDSRRRLRILYVGTSVAMLPALFVVVYRIASGRQGGFFELVPAWLAIYALVSMLLFPLTMAYVIVVQRAMDVTVVIRQGIQYALAKNGVRVLQAISLVVLIFATVYVTRNYTNSLATQLAIIIVGIAFIPVVEFAAKNLSTWIDRRFFREAYNAEQILADLSEQVRTMVETRPLLETVAGKISESLFVPQVALLLRNNGNFVPAYTLGFDVEPKVALGRDSTAMRKLGTSRHITLYDDMTEATSVPTMSLDDREQLRELNSQLLLPVAAKGTLSGIISLSPKRSEEPYTPSDLRLLRSVATQTGLALENSRLTEAIAAEAAQKERLNRELEIAREVQERLFPQELPRIEGLDFFGSCRPALGVGGDYYDFLELPDGKLGIAIGDISGKGIGASLMMASLQASLRGQSIHFRGDLAGLMTQINGLVYDTSTTNRYATFFYAEYDPATKLLAYVNAGHNPPFLLRPDGEVLKLEEGGPVVGMLPPMLADYTQGEIKLRSGDLLAGYTDGISEAMNPQEEEWSEDAMLDCLKTVADKPSQEILPHIVAAADAFANGAKQHDDMTMIIVKVL